jgi:hypothetical protein
MLQVGVVLRRLLRDNKCNSAAISGSSLNVTTNICNAQPAETKFSKQVPGGIDMFSNCRNNALIKIEMVSSTIKAVLL